MKKLALILFAIMSFALIVGCQMPDEQQTTPTTTDITSETVEPSSEEVQISEGLEEIEQLDTLDQDINFDELENLPLE
ncbi:hypothetical protein COY27_05060 [Candidatus Woesearchaeota archaeon CG_4_10_14_0_2_um_filter_33_13]|nr:MAG: hypothetical protein COY27_05060 [Candidatus Woesearchaeota archaeon CG_4_10_14_0_2_um_filter_33_13]